MPWPNPEHTASENASNAPQFPNFSAVYRSPVKRSAEEIQRGLDAVFSAPATVPSEAVDLAERRHLGAAVQLRHAERMLLQCRRLGNDDTLALLAVEHAQEAVMVAGDLLIEALDVAAGRRDAA